MAKEAAVNVRLDNEVDAELESVAATIGTTKSSLIRMLTRTFVEQTRGRDFNLPVKWLQILEPPDRRTANHQVAEGNRGPVTQIGSHATFTSGTPQRGGGARKYKIRRAKK